MTMTEPISAGIKALAGSVSGLRNADVSLERLVVTEPVVNGLHLFGSDIEGLLPAIATGAHELGPEQGTALMRDFTKLRTIANLAADGIVPFEAHDVIGTTITHALDGIVNLGAAADEPVIGQLVDATRHSFNAEAMLRGHTLREIGDNKHRIVRELDHVARDFESATPRIEEIGAMFTPETHVKSAIGLANALESGLPGAAARTAARPGEATMHALGHIADKAIG